MTLSFDVGPPNDLEGHELTARKRGREGRKERERIERIMSVG